MTNRSVFTLNTTLLFVGLFVAFITQNQNGNIALQSVTIKSDSDAITKGILYKPNSASSKKPAPGILAIHGYINSNETQSGFAIEFARRGYVVLAIDQRGHGFSQPPAFAEAAGAPMALAYLRNLPFVDKDNIGLEGHSMGGFAVLYAAATFPDDYKAMVLQGSATGASGFAPEGTPEFPRNVSVVFSQYDEFSKLMWGVDKAKDVLYSAQLKALFGSDEPVKPDTLYGDIGTGNARILHTPPVTHPGDHISTEAIGHAINWFEKTLATPQPLAASNQVWMWKELGTLLALIGFIGVMLTTTAGLLTTPLFSKLVVDHTPQASGFGPAKFSLFILIPIATYLPAYLFAEKFVPPTALFPQQLNNSLSVWLLLNSVISGIALWRQRDQSSSAKRTRHLILPSALFALLILLCGYLFVELIARLLLLDLRFWVFAIKPFASWHITSALVYLVPTLIYFTILAKSVLRNIALTDSLATAIARCKMLLCGGFATFLAIQYIGLWISGALPLGQPLFTIIAIQFLIMLAIVGMIIGVLLTLTRQPYPAAFLSAGLVTWIVVAGQATHI